MNPWRTGGAGIRHWVSAPSPRFKTTQILWLLNTMPWKCMGSGSIAHVPNFSTRLRWSASHPSHFTPGEGALANYLMWGMAGPRAKLDAAMKIKTHTHVINQTPIIHGRERHENQHWIQLVLNLKPPAPSSAPSSLPTRSPKIWPNFESFWFKLVVNW